MGAGPGQLWEVSPSFSGSLPAQRFSVQTEATAFRAGLVALSKLSRLGGNLRTVTFRHTCQACSHGSCWRHGQIPFPLGCVHYWFSKKKHLCTFFFKKDIPFFKPPKRLWDGVFVNTDLSPESKKQGHVSS